MPSSDCAKEKKLNIKIIVTGDNSYTLFVYGVNGGIGKDELEQISFAFPFSRFLGKQLERANV